MKLTDLLADPTLPVCSSGKRPHRTEADARAALRHVRRLRSGGGGDRQRRPGHVEGLLYECDACQHWHLAERETGKPGRRQDRRSENKGRRR